MRFYMLSGAALGVYLYWLSLPKHHLGGLLFYSGMTLYYAFFAGFWWDK